MLKIKSNGKSHTLCEEIQYSTTEAEYTGKKWIDGKKIYSLVSTIAITNSSEVQSFVIDLPTNISSKIDTIVSLLGIWKVNGLSVTIPRPHRDNENDGIQLACNANNQVWINWGKNNGGGGTATVILEFTLSE